MGESSSNDDEDMADLFSFGPSSDIGTSEPTASSPGRSGVDSIAAASPSLAGQTTTGRTPTATANMVSNVPAPRLARRTSSSDSLDDMLDGAAADTTTTATTSNVRGGKRRVGGAGAAAVAAAQQDEDTKELLDWLDEEEDVNKTPSSSSKAAATPATATTTAATTSASASSSGTVVDLPPIFTTLQEALDAKESTTRQIKDLYAKECQQQRRQCRVDAKYRVQLYCRMICGKTLDDTLRGSLADSFEKWTTPSEEGNGVVGKDEEHADNVKESDASVWLRRQARSMAERMAPQMTEKRPVVEFEKDLVKLLLYHHQASAGVTASANGASSSSKNSTSVAVEGSETATTTSTASTSDPSNTADKENVGGSMRGGLNVTAIPSIMLPAVPNDADHRHHGDELIPAVASTLLSSGMPVTVASVALAQIVPQHMPLLRLRPTERWQAALQLHSEFYLLACYHVPLLVYHLDRYLPGWYCPRLPQPRRRTKEVEQPQDPTSGVGDDGAPAATVIGRNLERRGHLPPSWLMSHFAGECFPGEDEESHDNGGGGGWLPPTNEFVLRLWDGILASHSNATRFFLALALLEEASDDLMLLTGEELTKELRAVLEVRRWTKVDDDAKDAHDTWLDELWSRTRGFESSTPESVITQLQSAEDVAVQEALRSRQERAEAELQARLKAEAEAHRLVQERKADEARERLNRARLVAFYLKYAPEKEQNIDKIMTNYAGRLEVLDVKLKVKYGEGFNPAIKAKPSKPAAMSANKILASVNQGLGLRRKKLHCEVNGEEGDDHSFSKVSVLVTPAEVLPVVCWSKESAASRADRRRSPSASDRKQLRFYLIDSRSEEAAMEQGRFPTAVSVTPEAILDPERVKQNEEMFESLRGAVHIVVMGAGFAAIPDLYNQKLSQKLDDLMVADESRTNGCALFFIKQGYPFVSVLDGGFAAAHSWLFREGESRHHLRASSVLVDYNPEFSLFGQMEAYHRASTTEKAQRAMASLLESSLVEMTKRAQQLEQLAADLDNNEAVATGAARQGAKMFTNFFKGSGGGSSVGGTTKADVDTGAVTMLADGATTEGSENKGGVEIPKPSAFRMPFTRKQSDSSAASADDLGKAATSDGAALSTPSTGSADAPMSDDSGRETSRFKISFSNMLRSSGSTVGASETIDSSGSSDSKQTTSPASGTTTTNSAGSENSSDETQATAGTTTSPPSTAPNRFGMFLSGGGSKVAADQGPSNGSSSSPTGSSNDGGGATTTTVTTNRFKGWGAAINNTVKAAATSHSASSKSSAETSKSGTSGTAQASSSMSNMLLKRNPFAGFGGGNKQQQQQDSSSSTTATSNNNTGGGFNFRIPNMGRQGRGGGGGSANVTTTTSTKSSGNNSDEDLEISFDGNAGGAGRRSSEEQIIIPSLSPPPEEEQPSPPRLMADIKQV